MACGEAGFDFPIGMWGDPANLYVADSISVRKIEIETRRVTTLARSDGVSLYVSDASNLTIRRIALDTGAVWLPDGSWQRRRHWSRSAIRRSRGFVG